MSAVPTDPTYLEFIASTSRFVSHNLVWIRNHYNFPKDTIADLELCRARVSSDDLTAIFCLTLLWTLARYLSTEYLFKPFTRLCRMSAKDAEKYPESAWKFFFYLSTFIGILYIINDTDYFHQTHLIWQNFSIDDHIPKAVRVLYLVEISFYIHSVYAVLFLDEWRKDTLVMFVHHIITLCLLSLSLATKAHRVGVLVLLLHDSCDWIMEGTKCLLTLKFRGIFGKLVEVLTAIGFVSFLGSWAVCRLYWFPLKAIYSASKYFGQNQTRFPFMLVLYSMLWVILAMDVYWFHYIVKIAVNIVTGKSKIEDNREYDSTDSTANHKPLKSVSNGVNAKHKTKNTKIH